MFIISKGASIFVVNIPFGLSYRTDVLFFCKTSIACCNFSNFNQFKVQVEYTPYDTMNVGNLSCLYVSIEMT